MKTLIALIISLVFATSVLADVSTAVPKNPVKNPPQNWCPSPHELTKKELFWSAPQGWVSFGESFDTHIVSFIKAEWIGINVGKIICLYKGDKRLGFPIALEQKYNKLVPTPSGFKWKNLGGYEECVAQDVKDCPFEYEKPPAQKNIYEELDFFKGKKNLD